MEKLMYRKQFSYLLSAKKYLIPCKKEKTEPVYLNLKIIKKFANPGWYLT